MIILDALTLVGVIAAFVIAVVTFYLAIKGDGDII